MSELLRGRASQPPPSWAAVPYPRDPDEPFGDRGRRWRPTIAPPGDAPTAEGAVPPDDDLLERTLRFSGSYASDDDQVTLRRSSAAGEYSGARFTGHCSVCARAGLIPAAGEPLDDVRAAVQFAAAHDHGQLD